MTVTEKLGTKPEPADAPGEHLLDANPTCYSVTIFTQRWKEIRDFYVEILDAKVLSERAGRYCEMEMGGLPICLRKSEYGEMVSYFHLYLSLRNREPVLTELRRRGVIVTHVGPYTNFRDPEGRVIKLSEARTVVG
jgi:catechol 2,3-dioxygenase-like lactoylglutathione lyase family enzyme